MKIFHNNHHAQHAGRQEMFRGRLVDCHEVPDRLRSVACPFWQRNHLASLAE